MFSYHFNMHLFRAKKYYAGPVEGSVDCKKLELMVLNVVLFCLLSR